MAIDYPRWLECSLRSDHAGELGAVWIYRGILWASRDTQLRAFAEQHLFTESQHLIDIESILSPEYRSRLLPLWKLFGFIVGAIPCLVGKELVFHTIDAVESFVDEHYLKQINQLDSVENVDFDFSSIRELLIKCRADEILHRDEARDFATTSQSQFTKLWCKAVAIGSRIAVAFAMRI